MQKVESKQIKKQKLRIPLKIDPNRAVQQRLDYDGVVSASNFARLEQSVNAICDDVHVVISFDKDAQGLKVIKGTAYVLLRLTCQRCFEGFDHEQSIEFSFSPVANEDQAEELPSHYEAAFVDEFGELNLVQLLEDELIIALPQVAMHRQQDCSINVDNMVFGEIPDESSRENPFAVLASLKR